MECRLQLATGFRKRLLAASARGGRPFLKKNRGERSPSFFIQWMANLRGAGFDCLRSVRYCSCTEGRDPGTVPDLTISACLSCIVETEAAGMDEQADLGWCYNRSCVPQNQIPPWRGEYPNCNRQKATRQRRLGWKNGP